MRAAVLVAVLGALAPSIASAAPLEARAPAGQPSLVGYVNRIEIAGDAADLSGKPKGANGNRLGGFGSDFWYDRKTDTYYALPDRGPGGGLLSYETRFHTFGINVDKETGAISNFALKSTVMLKDATGKALNGQNPELLNKNRSVLGRSFDSEGIAMSTNGNILISDEYGPSVVEFTPKGKLVRRFEVPANLVPKRPDGSVDYTGDRDAISSGRQDNRGFEGLARRPDGSRVVAMLQDPLDEEGSKDGKPDGRYGRYIRMVEYIVKTGKPNRQWFYQLESYKDINDRLKTADSNFTGSNQGRSIGISSIISLTNTQYLVLERDNRGVGVEDAAGEKPVGSKRIYLVDTLGASDVRYYRKLRNSNTLPTGAKIVKKTLLIDMQAEFEKAGITVPEKLEAMAVGPQLNDGSYLLLVGNDNDFSVTQTGSGEQFDVCADGKQVKLDAGCGSSKLVPSYLFAFKVKIPGYVVPK